MDLGNNSRLDCVVASLEAIVDLAVSAPRICDLIEGQIDDPICYVAASPKRKDDGVEIGRVSGETLDVSGRVGESLRVLKRILAASSTIPSVDASYALIGDRREVAQLKRQGRSVCQLRGDQQTHQHQC